MSSLQVAGAQGQVIVDDALIAYAKEGTSPLMKVGRPGEIRFDAQLVVADGKPGRWRFDFRQSDHSVRARVRVIQGEVVQRDVDGIVFALKGRAGERISFTVEAWR